MSDSLADQVAADKSVPTTELSFPPPTVTTPRTTVPSSSASESNGDGPDRLTAPTAAVDLADALTVAEQAVRDDALDALAVAAWGRRQQFLYRVLANNPEWAPEVLTAVDPSVRFAVETNWSARRELLSLVNSSQLATNLPAWRIRDPLPVEELLDHYREAETATGIEWEYLAAINLIETRMGRIVGLSTAGATGPMQFLPSTWEECCVGDPSVDRDAIIGAGTYLALTGGPNDMARALRRYNNSDYYVNAVSAYTAVLQEDPAAYRGYHAWEVYFLSDSGLIRMPTGYEEPAPVPVAEWLAENADRLVSLD